MNSDRALQKLHSIQSRTQDAWRFRRGSTCARYAAMLREERRYVYILRSESDPTRHYVGTASNPRDRLRWHNEGPEGYTRAYRPWALLVSMEFSSEQEAVRFERYLKSGSGRAFAKRHFAPGIQSERARGVRMMLRLRRLGNER